MIEKAKVSKIIIRHAGKIFVVFGQNPYGQSKKRIYKVYAQALRYSLQLSDYYQAEVIEQ